MNLTLFNRILIKVTKTKSYFALYNVYKLELYVNNMNICERVHNYRINPIQKF